MILRQEVIRVKIPVGTPINGGLIYGKRFYPDIAMVESDRYSDAVASVLVLPEHVVV
jgi:hypothetical protein